MCPGKRMQVGKHEKLVPPMLIGRNNGLQSEHTCTWGREGEAVGLRLSDWKNEPEGMFKISLT